MPPSRTRVSRSEYAERLLAVYAGTLPLDHLLEARSDDPFVERLLFADSVGSEGVETNRRVRHADALDANERAEVLRILLWCLSDSPPPARRSLVDRVRAWWAGRASGRGAPTATWPFDDSESLERALAAHEAALKRELSRAGLGEWVADVNLAALATPKSR
jgi:hypothetical protein